MSTAKKRAAKKRHEPKRRKAPKHNPSTAHTTLHRLAGELVRCSHPDKQPLVTGAPMRWCGRCGSMLWDGRWQRPHLHEPIADAAKAIR